MSGLKMARPAGRTAGRVQNQSAGPATNHNNYSALAAVETALATWPTEVLGHLLDTFDTQSADFFCPCCQPPARQVLHAPAAHAVGQHRWYCVSCKETRHRHVVADAVRGNEAAFARLLDLSGVDA